MPVPVTFGCCLLAQASPHAYHCLSRHIGSLREAVPNSVGELGKQTQPLVPARNCLACPPSFVGQSIIVACLLICVGAALSASAIFAASVTFAPALPDPDFEGMACWAYKTAGMQTTATSDVRKLRPNMASASTIGLG